MESQSTSKSPEPGALNKLNQNTNWYSTLESLGVLYLERSGWGIHDKQQGKVDKRHRASCCEFIGASSAAGTGVLSTQYSVLSTQWVLLTLRIKIGSQFCRALCQTIFIYSLFGQRMYMYKSFSFAWLNRSGTCLSPNQTVRNPQSFNVFYVIVLGSMSMRQSSW